MPKKYIFGIKHATFIDRITFKPLGIFEVIGGVSFNREIEKLLLEAGHSNGAYAIESGTPSNEITMTLKEYPNVAFSIFDNATITGNETEGSTGFVDTIANKVGTSVFNATTGIASIAAIAGSEDKIPFGRLIFVAVSATEVDVYLDGDRVDGKIPIISDLPKIASAVTIPDTGATVDLTDYGIEITGGSGTVAFTEDDTAYASTRPANTKTDIIKIKDDSSIENYGLVLTLPKNAEKEQITIRFSKVAVAGMSFGAVSREFSEYEQVMTPLVDPDEDNTLYEIQRVKTIA